jgi:hypothetical protein
MTWAHLDDSFDSHPKVMKAGNAAAGLFARLIAYSSRLLTDGAIAGAVMTSYGTKPQIDKLVRVGLAHRAGHACPRCAQPDEGDYVIHDYLQWNKSRAKVLAERKTEADKKRNQRAAGASPRPDPPTNRDRIEDDSNFFRDVNTIESKTKSSLNSGNGAAHSDLSPRESSPRARDIQSTPLLVPPTEVQLASPRAASAPQGGSATAASCGPLVEAMTAAGMAIGWNLTEPQWAEVRHQIDRCTIPVLVERAAEAWHRASSRPRSAVYFLRCWADLPAIPPGTPTSPALPGRPAKPSATDAAINRGLDIKAQMVALDAAEQSALGGPSAYANNVVQFTPRGITA